MQTRPFSREDWFGFAGCVQWPNGDDPLIGDGTLEDGKEFVVVFDPTGCCLVVEEHPVSLAGGWILELPFPTRDAARAFGTGMGTPTCIDDFLRLGFREA